MTEIVTILTSASGHALDKKLQWHGSNFLPAKLLLSVPQPTVTYSFRRIAQTVPLPASTRLGLKQKYWRISQQAGVKVLSVI